MKAPVAFSYFVAYSQSYGTWYEAEAPGLGRRFREAIDTLTERMSANPRQFPVVFKNVRGALLRRFPYSLFFVVEEEALFVIACFHARLQPRSQPRSVAVAKAHLISVP